MSVIPHAGKYEIPLKSPALLKIRKTIRKTLPKDKKYTLGLSGGSDSMALAIALSAEGYTRNVTIVIVDHQIQEVTKHISEESCSYARELGFEDVKIVPITVYYSGEGMEADARNARYEVLFEHAEDKNVIVGHTKNDQAESFLLGLSRGSGSKSISGMSIISYREQGTIYRPMLEDITKLDTREACDEVGISYWEDPQNSDTDFKRVAIRKQLLPLMEDILGGGIIDKLCETSHQVRNDHDRVLAAVMKRHGSFDKGIYIPIASSLDGHECSLLVAEFFRYHNVTMKKVHVHYICSMIYSWKGQAPLHLSGKSFTKVGDYIVKVTG